MNDLPPWRHLVRGRGAWGDMRLPGGQHVPWGGPSWQRAVRAVRASGQATHDLSGARSMSFHLSVDGTIASSFCTLPRAISATHGPSTNADLGSKSAKSARILSVEPCVVHDSAEPPSGWMRPMLNSCVARFERRVVRRQIGSALRDAQCSTPRCAALGPSSTSFQASR